MLPATLAVSACYLGVLAVTERTFQRSRLQMVFLNAAALALAALAVLAHAQGRFGS